MTINDKLKALRGTDKRSVFALSRLEALALVLITTACLLSATAAVIAMLKDFSLL